jgi:homoserine/homoserine lactone efflux protein
MKHYPLFVLMATITVFSPGPGVLLTLTNALRHSLYRTFGGILGIASGAFVVAAISATGAGIVLATSATAFTVMKYVGAVYLFFLGIKLWRAPVLEFKEEIAPVGGFGRRYIEGIAMQLTNPKVIFFFLSIFPQFIDATDHYTTQFATLVMTYSALVVLIHLLYALMAHRAKGWLSSAKGSRAVNRVGGVTFILFGAALANANR